MKRILSIILALGLCTAMNAQSLERVYLATDNDVYLAGEIIWCSAYCLDADGNLGSENAVAYVEVVSTQGQAATGKIALQGGRGAGCVILPTTVPTGNYRIFAYTAAGKNENGYKVQDSGKTISIFNTFSTDRVEGGVKIVQTPSSFGKRQSLGSVTLSATDALGEITVELENTGNSTAYLSLGVAPEDGIHSPETGGIASFVRNLPKSKPSFAEYISERDGEVVYGHLYGKDAAETTTDIYALPFISIPNAPAEIYPGIMSQDGTISFLTNNIFGDTDVVCEVMGLDKGKDSWFFLNSPFVNPKIEDIPALELSAQYSQRLSKRTLDLQKGHKSDTLYEFLPKRENLLFDKTDFVTYHLDDYTRFNTVQDILVEFVPQLRVRKGNNGQPEVQMSMKSHDGLYGAFESNVLLLMDGVPISNTEYLLEFDAMLLSDIDIYQWHYNLGPFSYNGIVNFRTTNNDLAALRFDDNVRILDYQGVSYPVKTDVWNPLLEVPAGEKLTVRLSKPADKYRITLEGICADGSPVCISQTN